MKVSSALFVLAVAPFVSAAVIPTNGLAELSAPAHKNARLLPRGNPGPPPTTCNGIQANNQCVGYLHAITQSIQSALSDLHRHQQDVSSVLKNLGHSAKLSIHKDVLVALGTVEALGHKLSPVRLFQKIEGWTDKKIQEEQARITKELSELKQGYEQLKTKIDKKEQDAVRKVNGLIYDIGQLDDMIKNAFKAKLAMGFQKAADSVQPAQAISQ